MGGKNQKAANSSWTEISKKGSVDAPKKDNKAQKCKKGKKHWIGVRVEDEDGKLVKDVTIHAKLEDAEYGLDMATAALDGEGVSKTKKIFDSTECEFSFPDVFDVEWWPKGGAAPAAFPDEQDIHLGSGDCAISAADKAGFRNYHSVWDCDGNKETRKYFPNPNQIVVPSGVKGPDKKVKTVKRAMDQTWTFVVRSRKPPKLRLILVDKEGKPLKDKAWELTKLAEKGKTGANGMIQVASMKLMKLTREKLTVTLKEAVAPPTATPTATPPAPTVPPYPPNIVPADFKDKMPDPDYTAQVVKWDLRIHLDPFSVHLGVLGRLQNLGFNCSADVPDDSLTDEEFYSVPLYAKLYSLDGEVWEQIKDDLKVRHDKP